MEASLSPRKMPRQSRAIATRDAIIDAATHIIAKGGLAAFNTNAVAARAGVSIGSLYQYFPNKDALMAALIARQQGQQIDNVEAVAAALQGKSLEVMVRALVRAAMQHHREDALLASAIDHEEARLPVGAIVDRELARGGDLISALLEQLFPQLPPPSIARAAHTLPAMVRAVVDVWANRAPPQLDAAEDEAVSAVLGYLRTVTTMPGIEEAKTAATGRCP